MHRPSRFARICAVVLIVLLVLALGYPTAFVVQHGWNPDAWPGNVPVTPFVWLREWLTKPGVHYVNLPLIIGTYREMYSGQSIAFAGGGSVEAMTLGIATLFLSSLIILGGKLVQLRDPTNMYGSAQWASKRDRAGLDRGLEMGIDPDTGRPIRIRVEGNLLTIAPPRTGKTNGFIIPNLVFPEAGAWAGPAVVIDPKGDAFRATRRRRAGIGKTVRCIDPLGLADGTDRWNPLSRTDPNDVLYLQSMARALLPPGDPNVRDSSYFQERAVDLIVASIVATIRNNRADPVGAAQLLLDQPAFLSALENRTDQISVAARNILTMDEKSRASIVSTAELATQWLRDDRMQAAVQNHTFELADLRSGEVDLFIVLPADERKETLAPYVRWLLADLFATVRQEKPTERIIVFIDEAFVLGRFDAILKGTGELPGYGISLWTFWQSRHQLIETYGPAGAETFIGTAEVVNLFNLPAAQPDEAEHWSRAIGTYTGVKVTKARDPKTGQISETQTAEAVRLVPQSDLPKFLQQWQVMFLTSRAYTPDPIQLRRTLAYNDARFRGLVDAVAPIGRN